MDLFIGYTFAARYWLTVDRNIPTNRRAKTLNSAVSCKRDAEPLVPIICTTSYPLDVMTRSRNTTNSEKFIFHSSNVDYPSGSFAQIEDHVYLPSPELTFIQMSKRLPFASLVEFGNYLCGTFTYGIEGGLSARKPLSSSQKIRSYINRAKNIPGKRAAEIAAQYIKDGCASPMESITALLLSLPHKRGGYGWQHIELNKRINLGARSKLVANKSYYVADIYIPKGNLIIEYDSDSFHTASDAIASDSKRRNALSSAGYQVISLTKQQLYSLEEMDKISKLIAHATGVRESVRLADFYKRKKSLRNELMFSGNMAERLRDTTPVFEKPES